MIPSIHPARRLFYAAVCIAFAFSPGAFAQESEALPSGDTRLDAELRALADPPLPRTNDTQEQCIALHKRGNAYDRLGRYDEALRDLKQALSLSAPDRLTPYLWCDRWRLQNDLRGIYATIGERFAELEFVERVTAEWKPQNARCYFFTQIWEVDTYLTLNKKKEADQAYRNAADAMAQSRTLKDWQTESDNVLDLYTSTAALILESCGNWVEAEHQRRASADPCPGLPRALSLALQPGQRLRASSAAQRLQRRALSVEQFGGAGQAG
ncbi:MAG: tetratricopeptide repeat protein [Candidatus Protistobacter heckmanni]|nr:tetratricopeptide repeat protein [Candidatus Protistobacter heckmanni]